MTRAHQSGLSPGCPPEVEDWHGATGTTSVTHYAIQANVDGAAVNCGEKVTEEDYGQQGRDRGGPAGRVALPRSVDTMSQGHIS